MSKRNRLQSLLDSSIADPSDFPQKELGHLDSSLTCKICREFYRGPVSLSCGHCFCSLCIRNSMTSKQECPVCRKNANEGQLRPIAALEEITESWKAARAVVLTLATTNGDSSRPVPEESLSTAAGPSTPSKRRKLVSKDENLIDCPICHIFVSFDTINVHIDSGCKSTSTPSKPKQKAEWSKVFSKKSKDSTQESDPDHRLPKLNYHTMKEKQIRELLSQADLSTTGDKNVLMARHQQWTMLYNANQDRSTNQRQDVERLRKELKRWEGEGKAKKADIGDREEYQRLHKQDFVELIERARRSRPPLSKPRPGGLIEEPGVSEVTDSIEID